MFYRCEECGAYLDPEEICECKRELRGSNLKCCGQCGKTYDGRLKEKKLCDECFKNACIYVYKVGAKRKDPINVNGFLMQAFTVEEIEQLLKSELEERNDIGEIKKDYIYKNVEQYICDVEEIKKELY